MSIIAHLPGGFEVRTAHSSANGQFISGGGGAGSGGVSPTRKLKVGAGDSKHNVGKSKSLAETHAGEADTHRHLAKQATNEHEKAAHEKHADAHTAAAYAHKTGKASDHEAAHKAWGEAVAAHKLAAFHSKTMEYALKHRDLAASAERDRQGHL